MTNKEFDQWLRESLFSVRPEVPPDWDHLVQRMEESESQLDSGFDDAIRTSLAGIGSAATPDWTRMKQQIEADEVHFDSHIRESIEHLEVPYNPSTWPTLHEKLSVEEQLRRRLITAKVLEIVAILFLFLTFYNFFPEVQSNLIRPAEDLIRKELMGKETAMSPQPAPAIPLVTVTAAEGNISTSDKDLLQVSSTASIPSVQGNNEISEQALRNEPLSVEAIPITPLSAKIKSERAGRLAAFEVSRLTEYASLLSSMRIRNMLKSVHPAGVTYASSPLPLGTMMPVIPALTKASKVRFGMVAAVDVNTLFFPEEHFYSQGRSINFTEKEIVADGYSAGASVLFDFRKFMLETGFSYSSKDFGPDRNLFIGTSLDRHSLDFENITLDIVSLPLYLHWKVDGRGSWRLYATGGVSMHVIANANYDLIAENYYTSSAVQNPQQVQNAREVQRVREHMLDGAKFSSKGYLTAAGGIGVERYLNSRMSVFIQPMYEYQIPFFGLIDQNGKHLQNGSLLLGTRISL